MAYSNTRFIITEIFLIMGSAMVPAVRGISSNPQSFVLSNLRARYIVREFLLRSNASGEEIAKYNIKQNVTLFDFTTLENVDDWIEQSDVVRTVGKSKAVIELQKTEVFQRAVFFTLLNPQPNGAGFAGVRTETNFNLTGVSNIDINCRGQGQNSGYKIVLRHRSEDNEPYPTYEQFFDAPMSSENFSTISLPLSEFKPYYRGREVPDADSLDVTSITNFGLQVYGGVYETVHQSGVSSLEINTIIATRLKTGSETIPTSNQRPRCRIRRRSSVSYQFSSKENGNEMVASASGTVQTLFDFTRGPDQAGGWTEHSDTVKPSGMSKAVMVTQKTQLFQRAIFFTLFNPQPNGSGFAAVRCDTKFDLSEFSNIIIRCRGQGINTKYKMLLRHKGLGKDAAVYGQIFSVSDKEFTTVRLPLTEFKPYYRGMELPLQTHPLDIAAITNIGIKVDNGQYLPENQPGVAALEIEWIKATKSAAT